MTGTPAKSMLTREVRLHSRVSGNSRRWKIHWVPLSIQCCPGQDAVVVAARESAPVLPDPWGDPLPRQAICRGCGGVFVAEFGAEPLPSPTAK